MTTEIQQRDTQTQQQAANIRQKDAQIQQQAASMKQKGIHIQQKEELLRQATVELQQKGVELNSIQQSLKVHVLLSTPHTCGQEIGSVHLSVCHHKNYQIWRSSSDL